MEREYKPNKPRKNRTKDHPSTSTQEQAIFYNVKLFFTDAENRAILIDSKGKKLEVDIYIPNINVAIEYDGKYWHNNKVHNDNEKNRLLNKMGIYVIRVRDYGLPELEGFDGTLLIHGKPPNGQHLNEIIEYIIHLLGAFLPENQRQKFFDFRLSYDDYLIQRPSIEALLFTESKEKNFTFHPAYQYWDFSKNKELNPHNLDKDSNAFAWFICPKGDSIIRIIDELLNVDEFCLKEKTSTKYCIYSICPFMPHDAYLAHGKNCGQECSYVETFFTKMIMKYIDDGLPEGKIDKLTIYELKSYTRTAYEIMMKVLSSPEEIREKTVNFFFNVKSNGDRIRAVKLCDVKELKFVLKFNTMYPKIPISFNWDIFDSCTKTRQILIKYLLEFHHIHQYNELQFFIWNCKYKPSDELKSLLMDFSRENHYYISETDFDTLDVINELS